MKHFEIDHDVVDKDNGQSYVEIHLSRGGCYAISLTVTILALAPLWIKIGEYVWGYLAK